MAMHAEKSNGLLREQAITHKLLGPTSMPVIATANSFKLQLVLWIALLRIATFLLTKTIYKQTVAARGFLEPSPGSQTIVSPTSVRVERIYAEQGEQGEHVEKGDILASFLAYNINLELEPLTQERLTAVCRSACIFDDICRLPMGFNTQVGDMGVGLSAGQIQRVLLVRALYRNPRIPVLDEALSHLSTNVAHQIVENIREPGMTLILVSHNPELTRLADYSLQLNAMDHSWNDNKQVECRKVESQLGPSSNAW